MCWHARVTLTDQQNTVRRYWTCLFHAQWYIFNHPLLALPFICLQNLISHTYSKFDGQLMVGSLPNRVLHQTARFRVLQFVTLHLTRNCYTHRNAFTDYATHNVLEQPFCPSSSFDWPILIISSPFSFRNFLFPLFPCSYFPLELMALWEYYCLYILSLKWCVWGGSLLSSSVHSYSALLLTTTIHYFSPSYCSHYLAVFSRRLILIKYSVSITNKA